MKNYFGDTSRYEEIMNLPHHVSPKHPRMPAEDRAAQFAPFAALTGYGDAVREAARQTEKKGGADEERLEALDRTVRFLREKIKERPYISVTFFQPDEKKEGGSYVKRRGNLKKVDEYRRKLILTDGTEIFFDYILEIGCEDEAGNSENCRTGEESGNSG